MSAAGAPAPALHVVKIEDREGDGTCGACGREGLRWIATLSDSRQIGLECAKKALGHRPAPSAYRWAEHYAPAAEHAEGGDTFVLWRHKTGAATVETRNGLPTRFGGALEAWRRLGWAD